MSADRVFKCRATVGVKDRCPFEGDAEAAGAHAVEAGHARCCVCREFLAFDETGTCLRCVGKVRSCLLEITECVALAPSVIEHAAYRGVLLVDLLAMIADGSIESAVQQQHPELYQDVEWRNDPLPIVAVLYGIEASWRGMFGHGPRMSDATISSCAGYLLQHLPAAVRLDGFEDDADVIKRLANRLRHMVGVADDPVQGTKCLDCPDVTLVRPYRPPVWPVPDFRRSADGQRGLDPEGLDDVWHCRACKRDYTPAEYGLALRQRAADAQGWVTVALAFEVSGRHRRVIVQWTIRRDGEDRARVASRLDAEHRRMEVWMPDVHTQHQRTQVRLRRAEPAA